jgi:hypothetical protein
VLVRLRGAGHEVGVVEAHAARLQQHPVQQLQLGAAQGRDLRLERVAYDQALFRRRSYGRRGNPLEMDKPA